MSDVPSVQEREEKLKLQAQIKRLWEDNQRLQEESQNSAAKLKKFTEWVFNTIDLNWEHRRSSCSVIQLHPGPTRAAINTPTLPGSESEIRRRNHQLFSSPLVMFNKRTDSYFCHSLRRFLRAPTCRDESVASVTCITTTLLLTSRGNPTHLFFFFFLSFKSHVCEISLGHCAIRSWCAFFLLSFLSN